MRPTTPDEKADYFEAIATKLEDWDAYLQFLETKLETTREPRQRPSGFRLKVGDEDLEAPVEDRSAG